jgi:hypothetical protein
VALSAESGTGVDERDGRTEAVELVGVESSLCVAISPLSTPSRRVLTSEEIVRFSSVVFPAPGEDMRLTVVIPVRAKSARFIAAIRSFSARIDSSTMTRSLPVSG